jgi:hypothetical protein
VKSKLGWLLGFRDILTAFQMEQRNIPKAILI